MRIRALLATLSLVVAGAALPGASADAAVVTTAGPLFEAGNGIAVGVDGNLWVVETSSVVRINPVSGAEVGRIILNGTATSIANGPAGKLWATLTTGRRLAVIDTTLANPAFPTYIPTPAGSCGPSAIVAGGNGRMYFSEPSSEGCAGASKIASVADTGTSTVVTESTASLGPSYDLVVASGKLFAPDFDGDVVRRLTLAAAPVVDATFPTGAGSTPSGITVDGAGTIWVTSYERSELYRFSATLNAGAATVVPLPGGTLQGAFGIVATSAGRILATGSISSNVVSLALDGTGAIFSPGPAGSSPWQTVQATSGDLFATDLSQARVLRIVDAAPTVTTTSATATGATTASVVSTVDARGNATQVVIDYGTTTAYGASTPATTVAPGALPVPSIREVTGLRPGTTYHLRVRATNALGTTTSPDTTVTTAAAPVVQRTARTKLGATKLRNGSTKITGLKALGVQPGDKVSVSCKGRGCEKRATTKPARVKKAGTFSLTEAVKGLVLAPGAKLTVRLRFAGGTGAVVGYTMVEGKKPKRKQR
jgi:streptogramin lyase